MSTARYDMLEVLLDHSPQSNPATTLFTLQDLLEPRFELEPLEYVARGAFERRRQVVRICSVMGEAFSSAEAFDVELRELTGDGYAWSWIGAIRAGQATTVRG